MAAGPPMASSRRMFDFSDRALLLTGANGGIGRANAEEFLEAGASVVLADIDERGLTAFASGLDAAGTRTEAVKLDAGKAEDVDRAIERCLARFGRLDFLVTAAAIYEDHPFESMSD